MNTKFFYALAWTLCGAVFQLLLFFTGYQTEKLATGQYLQWFGLVIAAGALYLGIKAVRDERPGGTISYGQAVSAGMVISVLTALMSAVYGWFHFTFINTRFTDYTMDMVRRKWAAAGMSQAQMDAAEGITKKMMSPPVQAVIGIFFVLVIGLVISLIVAAIVKRDKPVAAPAAVPPAAPPA